MTLPPNPVLSMEPCIDFEMNKGVPDVNQSYSKSQLFHFHPLRKGAQSIRAVVGHRNQDKVMCLTVDPSLAVGAKDSENIPLTMR